MTEQSPAAPQARPWRWRLVPIGLIGVPVFLAVSLIVLSPVKLLIGPVNVFNVTRENVPAHDIAGFYALGEDEQEHATRSGVYLSGDSGISLHENHSLRVIGFPAFTAGLPSDCHLNATGTWKLIRQNGEARLVATLTSAVPAEAGELPSCGLEGFELRLLGHHAPYQLRYEFGDGDVWHALLYARK